MVLSPADFYAYSRATGTPVPQDPEERAAVAPDVLEFRRNQLKSEPEGQNLLATLGIGALATAGAVALGLAGRRALRGPAKSVTSPLTTEDLSRYEAGSTRRAAAQAPVPPSQPAPTVAQPGAPTEEERRQVYAAVASKPETELPRVYRPKGGHQEDVLVTDPNTGEMFRRGKSPASFAEQYISLRPELQGQKTDLPINRTPGTFKEFSQSASSFSPRQYVESTGSLAPTDLTSVQESTAPLQQDQFINAVESGEDQQTGRVMQRLQSNEDLDLSQVELLEEMAERSRLENMEQDAPINQAASQLPDGLPVDQAEATTRRLSSQELADIAKSEMIALRQELEARGLQPGTQRFERALAQSWRTKAIPGAEPGTTKFRKLQEQGKIDVAMPGVIGAAVESVEKLPEEEALPNKFLRSVVNVGPEAQVTSTAMGTAIRGASPIYETYETEAPTRQVFGQPDVLVPGAPDDVMADYPSRYTALHQILSKTELPERIDPYAKKRLAGGSPGIGVYGLELSYVPGAVGKSTGTYSAAASRSPSYVPEWLQKQQARTGFDALSTAQVLSGAQKAKAPSIKAAFEAELNRRQTAKTSLAVSELLRRGRIEGTLQPSARVMQGPQQSATTIFNYPESIRVVPAPLKKQFL